LQMPPSFSLIQSIELLSANNGRITLSSDASSTRAGCLH
jgi:hypothetical protein